VTIDVTDATFMTEVVERSRTVPVVVDLWAPWCGPCQTLGPILEKVCDATNGQVVLAKVNVDENPGVARAFQVQSIPAVYAIRDGQPVSEFMGTLPEHEVKKFVDALLPDQSALLVDAKEVQEERPVEIPQDGKDVELEALLPRVKADEEARKKFLEILESMGADDPRVAGFRKRFTAQIF
jgi:putative thioredoxin